LPSASIARGDNSISPSQAGHVVVLAFNPGSESMAVSLSENLDAQNAGGYDGANHRHRLLLFVSIFQPIPNRDGHAGIRLLVFA
jgi:hypothetical protein